jgi:N-acetylglucosamine-6-sulfatase
MGDRSPPSPAVLMPHSLDIQASSPRAVRLATAALILAIVAGLAALAGERASGARGAQPNVVVVMTDDQDAASVRVMRSVNRSLADRGVTFARSYATFPLCCPSRATYLTGQYAHNHGVESNVPPEGGWEIFRDSGAEADGLPVALQGAGYRTGFVGKYLNGYGRYVRQVRPVVPPGWDRWWAPLSGRMFGFNVNDDGRIVAYKGPNNYRTDVEARQAARFIRSGAGGPDPFFLTVMSHAIHSEGGGRVLNPRPAPRHRGAFRDVALPRPPSFNERDVSDKPSLIRDRPRLDREARELLRLRYRGRLEGLLSVDEAVARIVKALRREGELGNTYILFTSDNGYHLGEHRVRGKTLLYEPSAQVPLIIRGPGIPRDARRRQLVGNIDLAPTILDLAGAEPMIEPDGISLLPLAADPDAARGRDLLLENAASSAVRTTRYAYMEHDTDGGPGADEFELYDQRRDPHQLRSRHDAPGLAEVRARLAGRLAELADCAGAGCRR